MSSRIAKAGIVGPPQTKTYATREPFSMQLPWRVSINSGRYNPSIEREGGREASAGCSRIDGSGPKSNGPNWVTGGKARREYMFSGLPQIADIVRSSFQYLANPPQQRIARSGSSNSMLGYGPTTPQDSPETTGFAPPHEHHCRHPRYFAD